MFTKKFIIALFLITPLLGGCNKKEASDDLTPREQVIMVNKKPLAEQLYFNGTIKPIRVTKIASPQDGTVREIHFVYGENVNKDQLLLTIQSKKLQENFQQAFSKFLTNKEQMLNSTVNFEGAKLLYDADIISKQEYLNEKNRFENNKLNFIEARFKFEDVMREIPDLNTKDVEGLRLSDVNEFQKLYNEKVSALPINSTATGIVLFPDKEDDEKQKRIIVGTQVNKDQSLLSIGNMEGIEVSFTVDQKDINKIHKGQSVTVSNEVFGKKTLAGKIESVAVQSTSKEDSDKADFPVRVVVTDIDKAISELIRIGMKVKVQVAITGPTQVIIPITAVQIIDGAPIVFVINTQGEKEMRRIETGKTLASEVEITSGLQPGDKIVVSD